MSERTVYVVISKSDSDLEQNMGIFFQRDYATECAEYCNREISPEHEYVVRAYRLVEVRDGD